MVDFSSQTEFFRSTFLQIRAAVERHRNTPLPQTRDALEAIDILAEEALNTIPEPDNAGNDEENRGVRQG